MAIDRKSISSVAWVRQQQTARINAERGRQRQTKSHRLPIPCNFLTCKKCRDFSWKQLNFVAPFFYYMRGLRVFSRVVLVVAVLWIYGKRPLPLNVISVYVEIAGEVYSSMKCHSRNVTITTKYVWFGDWTSTMWFFGNFARSDFYYVRDFDWIRRSIVYEMNIVNTVYSDHYRFVKTWSLSNEDDEWIFVENQLKLRFTEETRERKSARETKVRVKKTIDSFISFTSSTRKKHTLNWYWLTIIFIRTHVRAWLGVRMLLF